VRANGAPDAQKTTIVVLRVRRGRSERDRIRVLEDTERMPHGIRHDDQTGIIRVLVRRLLAPKEMRRASWVSSSPTLTRISKWIRMSPPGQVGRTQSSNSRKLSGAALAEETVHDRRAGLKDRPDLGR
jgi:hypothetical protein